MLKAVFNGHTGFIVLAVFITVVAGSLAYRLASRRYQRPALFALWVASAVGVLTLTLWTTGGGNGSAICTINKSLWEPFTTVQGRLNAGMFAPFGLIGVLATRRVVPVVLLGVLLTAAIETFQGILPFVSRLCDTSDFVSNSTGVACGVAFGALVNAVDKHKEAPAFVTTRWTLVASGMAVVVLAASWALWMTPKVVERTRSEVAASDEQREAIAERVHRAFGDAYTVRKVSFTPGEDGGGTVMAAVEGGGSAELDWPARERFSVNLVPSFLEAGNSFAIPGATEPVDSVEGAAARATTYAGRFAPWALDGSQRTAEARGKGDGLSWIVSWRRFQGDVLLPMRLDIVIEPSGHLTDLIARNTDDPRLPPVRVSEEEAWSALEAHFGRTAEESQKPEPVLLAQRREGEWRVLWLLTLRTKSRVFTATIDATTGKVFSPLVKNSMSWTG